MRYFAGSYTHKVDAKGRVSLPVAYRRTLDELGDAQVVLLPTYFGNDHHVALSETAHAAAIADIERRTDLSAAERRRMLRPLVAKALLLAPDDAGRIVLPREIREAVGIRGEARFTAMGPYFEIWSPEAHDAAEEVEDETAGPRSDLMGFL